MSIVIESNQSGVARKITLLKSRYRLTQPEISRLSGYSLRSIANWLSGSKVKPPAQQKFVELERLMTSLECLLNHPDEIHDWLNTPNKAFDGSTPLQVIERGESDRIWRMIYFLESGQPG